MAEGRLVKVIEESQIDRMAASSHFELKWYPIGFKTKWRLEQFKTDFQRETPYWKKKQNDSKMSSATRDCLTSF